MFNLRLLSFLLQERLAKKKIPKLFSLIREPKVKGHGPRAFRLYGTLNFEIICSCCGIKFKLKILNCKKTVYKIKDRSRYYYMTSMQFVDYLHITARMYQIHNIIILQNVCFSRIANSQHQIHCFRVLEIILNV